MRSLASTLALALGFSAWACGDDLQGDPDASRGQGLCAEETRADTFVAGLSRTTSTGAFELSFVEASPVPPDRGLNRWLLELKEASGGLVDDAELRVRPWMPDHGHGSNPPYLFPAATGAPGRYQLESMDLFMSGFWQFTIRVERGEQSDELVFSFCIEG